MDGPVQHVGPATRASPQRTSSRRQNTKSKPSHSIRRTRPASDKSDPTRRATKVTASRATLESLKRTHASRSSAADRPESACSFGSSYSDSSFSTHQSESALADYYSVESLSSFDSGVESLDSMLWMGDSGLPSPTDTDLAGPLSPRGFDGSSERGLLSDADLSCAVAPGASVPRTDNIPLPPGWLMKTTPDGKPYFVNKNKRVTSWLDPRTNRPAAATQRSGLAPARMYDSSNVPLPEGWEMAMSDNGVPYFIDHIHRRTTWNDPRALMFEQQRETHRLQQLNQANADLRRKIEAIRKQQARLEQEMLRSASPEAIGLAKMKAQADAYAILTLQAQQDTLQRQIEASAYGRLGGRLGALHSMLPDVPEGEPTSPTFLNELASVRKVASTGRRKRSSGRRPRGARGIKVERSASAPTPSYNKVSSKPTPDASVTEPLIMDTLVPRGDPVTDLSLDLDVVTGANDCAPNDSDVAAAVASLGDVDLSVLGVDDLPLSPTAVEDFFGSWSV